MAGQRHDPPGFNTDLVGDNKQAWSDLVSSMMLTKQVSPTLTPQFFDAALFPGDVSAPTKITWLGFPRIVRINSPNDEERWRRADAARNVQDEYLEWSIKRNDEGKIIKVVFCNEAPEYFQFLGDTQPDTLVNLYQSFHPNEEIKASDLFDKSGRYKPINKWNDSTTTGTIMHLIQPNNTLAAQIDLGARATVVRRRADGTIITDADELIRCSRFGNPDRNSDPVIGAGINALARKGALLTVANPIGLYIDSINFGHIDPPAGHEDDDVSTFWKWTRGTQGYHGRAEFEVPKDKGYVLGDLIVRGRPLQFGGQLADIINVSISAQAAVGKTVEVQSNLCGVNPGAAEAEGPGTFAEYVKNHPNMNLTEDCSRV